MLKKHLILFGVCVVIALMILIVINSCPSNAKNYEIVTYFLIKAPLFGLVIIICGAILGLYNIVFSHNAIKLQMWQERESDPAKIKALSILPDWNSNLRQPIGELIIFYAIWLITLVVIFGMQFLLSEVFLGLIASIIGNVYLAIFVSVFPVILALFSKNYSVTGLLTPSLPFSVLMKVLIPYIILNFKLIIYSIIVSIINWVVIIVVSFIFFFSKDAAFFVIMSLCIYLAFIAQLGFTYAVAVIVHEKYVLEE